MDRKGIVLAGGSGTRLHPLTLAISKQIMPVYDKPMIHYPISALMLTGIREILIISTPRDLPAFRQLLGDGRKWGLRFEYAMQPKPEGLAQAFIIAEEYLAGAPACLVLGDNLFYGTDLKLSLRKADKLEPGATVFGYPVNNPSDYGVVELDLDGKVASLEEKPTTPKSQYAVPGIYFYDSDVCKHAKTLKPSARGELEITDLNRTYLEQGLLNVELLSRDTAWMDTGSHDALLDAAIFVRVIEKRHGLKVACLEEIAWRQEWISDAELESCATAYAKTGLGEYLRQLLKDPF